MPFSRPAWLLLLALAACTTPVQWEKPGASAAAIQADRDQCQALSRLSTLPERHPSTPGTKTAKVMERQEQRVQHDDAQFEKCMRTRGYSEKRP